MKGRVKGRKEKGRKKEGKKEGQTERKKDREKGKSSDVEKKPDPKLFAGSGSEINFGSDGSNFY